MTELILDICLGVVLVCFKTGILWVLIRLVDRERGEIRVHRAFGFTLLLSSTYILLNRSTHYVDVLLSLGVVILLGWLLFSRYCRISSRKAFLAATVIVLLGTQLSDSTRMGMDMLVPGRLTVTEYFAEKLDKYTWNMTGQDGENPQKSETLGGAIHAAFEHTIGSQVAGLFTEQLRAGRETDDRVEVISTNQVASVAFNDEQSSGGIDARQDDTYQVMQPNEIDERREHRGSETSKRPDQAIEDEGLTKKNRPSTTNEKHLPSEKSTGGKEGDPNDPGDSAVAQIEATRDVSEVVVVASSTDVLTEQAVHIPYPFPESNPVGRIPMDSPGSEKTYLPPVKVMEAEEVPDTAEVATPSEDIFMELSTGDVGIALAGLTRRERYKWREARKKVVVEASLTSNGRSMAVVNGKLVEPGEVIIITEGGTNFVFQLYAVSNFDSYWLPVDANEKSEVQKLLRMSW